MNNCKKLLGLVALSLLATATPVLAATMADVQYSTQAQTKSTKVTHQTYIETDDDNTVNNTTQTTQIKKIREATTEELNGEWTTNKYNGKWTYHLSDGKAYEGWLNDNGVWYYIKFDEMLTNTYINGEYLGTDGIWTEPPAVLTYANGESITKEGVQATKDLLTKLASEGWVYRYGGEEWLNDTASIYVAPSKSGIPFDTECKIKAGIATIRIYTEAGHKDFNNNKTWTKGDGHEVYISLDQYLEYKKQGKIAQATCYWSTNGIGKDEAIYEYIKS